MSIVLMDYIIPREVLRFHRVGEIKDLREWTILVENRRRRRKEWGKYRNCTDESKNI